MTIPRPAHLATIRRLLRRSPVVGLLGPRQIGKTTLASEVAAAWGPPVTRFDLERPSDLARLAEPELTLAPLRGLVVLDEIQRRPDLFPVLRVLADRPRRPARFLVLGSASPDLLRQQSETLAGRIAFHELPGFGLAEVPRTRLDRLWLRGGFPRSFTAASEQDSVDWRRDFVATFLERDLRALGLNVAPPAMGRFWSMLAHVHGQTLNWSELGRSLAISDQTVRRYTAHLEAALMVRVLAPWHENISRRQVKSPKVYLRDAGLLHHLLDIQTHERLLINPRLGASWEGFVIEQIIALVRADARQCFFWATHQNAELDLLVVRDGRRLGFEVKRTATPVVTASMRIAMETLGLERLDVVHARRETFPLGPRMRAIAASDLVKTLGTNGRA